MKALVSTWRFFLIALVFMSLYAQTTIVAIATPPGYGGIGVIRLSGTNAVLLTQKLLAPARQNLFAPNQVVFQPLIHPETNQNIDDALVTYFQAPQSYTGEDVVEISCHGSPVVLAEVVRLLVLFGAEPAQPGEFTMRAFLNQRLDLTQAEAVNDLIHAQTTYQAQLAARQLRGELSKLLQPIKNALIEIIVYFESSLEFVEDDLDTLDVERFQQRLGQLVGQLDHLIGTYRLGRLIRSGVRLALVGRPNVGKSSLFNRLLGKDRAIVTHLPGTTRDTVSEVFSLKGIPVELIDTAGLRETEDFVEKLGIERTRAAIADADFVIAILEANHQPAPSELEFFAQLPIQFYVFNKCDLGLGLTDEVTRQVVQENPFAHVSALTGEGIPALRDRLYSVFSTDNQSVSDGGIITNERHYQALEQSLKAMRQAKQDLSAGYTEEVVLVNLHEALRSLGIITGETLIGDIINQIFTTFCIGK
jgi:tRNA modification GTPase